MYQTAPGISAVPNGRKIKACLLYTSVEQNITFPLLLDYKRPNQKFVNELLNVLGLTERRHHLPSQLSGGQQQRVAIGRALVTRPALILSLIHICTRTYLWRVPGGNRRIEAGL